MSAPLVPNQDRLDRFARAGANIVVLGETGTGKELVAQRIHDVSGRSGPMVVLDCTQFAGVSDAGVVLSELFGHTKGAFTGAVSTRIGLFEAAHGGTLFLDELGHLPMSVQPMFLRALETGEFRRRGDNQVRRADVVVVSATSMDLDTMVREGRFLRDLYMRLLDYRVTIPPLRERVEDIPGILASWGFDVPAPILDELQRHEWSTGNVRELRKTVQRARLMSEGDDMSVADVRAYLAEVFPTEAPPQLERPALTRSQRVERVQLHFGACKAKGESLADVMSRDGAWVEETLGDHMPAARTLRDWFAKA